MYSRYFALLSPHVSSSSEQVQIIQAKGTQTSHLPAVVYLKKKKYKFRSPHMCRIKMQPGQNHRKVPQQHPCSVILFARVTLETHKCLGLWTQKGATEDF